MKHPFSWLAAAAVLVLMATPASADHRRGYHDRDYYDDDNGDDDNGDDATFGVDVGPDSFGLYFDQDDYDRYGRRGPSFGLHFDRHGGGIVFDSGDFGYEGRRIHRGHWYCPRRYCRGRGHWGHGYGRHHHGRHHGRNNCHPVFKRGYRRGRDVLIRGRMCYDRDGNAYIVPGSRRVVRRYD